MSNTMKEVIVSGNPLSAEIRDAPIPEPSANEVIVRVIVAGSNPKDWKLPVFFGNAHNSGDDHSGYVHAVGRSVTEFRPGDRVASLHVTGSPGGSYAEYAVAPAHTTFHIPPHISFEEAATIPMAAMTAAVGLYQLLQLPLPWLPQPAGRPKTPLVVYGGSTAVGAFALKLARLSGIRPIITVAGAGVRFVESLGIVDHVIDYRNGNVVADIKAALGGAKAYFALDAVSENGSYKNLFEVLENPGGKITAVLPIPGGDVPQGIEVLPTLLSSVHIGHPKEGEGAGLEDIGFGYVLYRYISYLLVEQKLQGHPYTLLEGGLGGVGEGLKKLKEGKASATKFVYRVAQE